MVEPERRGPRLGGVARPGRGGAIGAPAPICALSLRLSLPQERRRADLLRRRRGDARTALRRGGPAFDARPPPGIVPGAAAPGRRQMASALARGADRVPGD